VAQCHGVDTGLTSQIPYSARDGRAGQVGGTAPGYDSQAVSEDRRGGDSPFDPGARGVPEHLMLWSEEWARRHEPGSASSEAENRPRRRQPLERGGESPEGALGARARRTVARGGVSPSSEAENRPRGIAGGRLVGCCGFFGPWAFPLWAATTGSVFFRISSTFIYVYHFLK
jgi:hypothetical protein